jgi:hypothetical protein
MLFGVPGFILGTAVGALGGHLVTLALLVKAHLPGGRDDLIYTVLGIAFAVVGVGGPIWLERATGVPRMPTSIVLGVGILAPLGLLVGKRLLAQMRNRGATA